jgi:hypothetical protein
LVTHLKKEAVYFDLEDPDDRAKFANPSLLLDPLSNQTVILDEVQKLPARAFFLKKMFGCWESENSTRFLNSKFQDVASKQSTFLFSTKH